MTQIRTDNGQERAFEDVLPILPRKPFSVIGTSKKDTPSPVFPNGHKKEIHCIRKLMKTQIPVMMTTLMRIKTIARHGITHPFGDHRSVFQAFPAAISANEADPFLMCDYFGGIEEDGPVQDPDDFPVGWHPH